MEEKKSIKELKELLAGLEVIGIAAVKIGADKKVAVDDLKHLVDLAKDSGKIVDAVDGASEISAEAKDIDSAEALEIVGLLYQMAEKFAKAREEAKAS